MATPARVFMLILAALATTTGGAQAPADPGTAALSLAIRQGDLATVTSLVARAPSLATMPDASGFTPLHIAATAGQVAIAEFLLGRGADLEARTPGGQTPLFQTVPLDAGEAFAFLLSRGADLNARDNTGATILQFALAWRRPAMIERILAAGFVVDVTPGVGREMLTDAANAGLEPLVASLLSRGVRPDASPRDGSTLLHDAARGGVTSLAVRLLGEGAPVDARDAHGLTPLHLAALYGQSTTVHALLARGADRHARTRDGRTALSLARSAGHADLDGLLTLPASDEESDVPPVLSGPYLGEPDPGVTPAIFAPGIVSSEDHETNLAVSPGGDELCLSRISHDQARRWLSFMRVSAGRWTMPAAAPWASGGTDFECAYSSDGRRLFFASDRARDARGARRRDTDLWWMERQGDTWSAPRNAGPAVNGDSNEYMPSLDAAGNLFFERFGLNVAQWRDGAFSTAVPVGPIAGAQNPGHPFVARDGSYLLFDARSPVSGRMVLFAAFRQSDGTWSRAVRLLDGPEPRAYESCPSVSPDGRYLFFGRDHDIYWVRASVIDERRAGR